MKMNREFVEMIENTVPRQNLSPAAVERLENTYNMLGEQKKPVKNTFHRSWIVSASAVAAAFVLLFGVNAAFPAIAEELPVIGQFFQSINRRDVFQTSSLHGKTIQGTNVIGYGTQKINAVSQSGQYTMAVEDGFCDGKNLTLSMRLELPQEGAEQIEYILPQVLSLSVNGIDVRLNVNDILLFPDTNKGFTGTVTAALPQGMEPSETLQLSLAMSQFGGKDKNNRDFEPCIPLDASFLLEFSLMADSSYNRSFSCEAVDGSVTLLNVETSPISTELTAVMPGHYYIDGESALLLEDGTQLHFNHGKSTDITEEIFNSQAAECLLAFDGLPAGTEKAIFRQYKDQDHSQVLAEFTLDLQKGTAEVSKTYEENGPLNLDSPFDYRYLNCKGESFSEEKAVNGFMVTDLVYSAKEARFTVQVEKVFGDYREIQVDILNSEGTVVASDTSAYCTSINGSKTYWDETTPCWSTYSKGSDNAPNPYKIETPTLNYQPACGETLTVRITDTQTGETLVEQDILMNIKGH